jgi:hypothetical protein
MEDVTELLKSGRAQLGISYQQGRTPAGDRHPLLWGKWSCRWWSPRTSAGSQGPVQESDGRAAPADGDRATGGDGAPSLFLGAGVVGGGGSRDPGAGETGAGMGGGARVSAAPAPGAGGAGGARRTSSPRRNWRWSCSGIAPARSGRRGAGCRRHCWRGRFARGIQSINAWAGAADSGWSPLPA